VALYENGSFVARLELPVLHRFLRNPDLFSVKTYVISGARAAIVKYFSALLQASAELVKHSKRPTKRREGNWVASILRVVSPLLKRAQNLLFYTQKTKQVSKRALAVRSVLFAATEPDELFFSDLLQAV